MSSRTAFFVRRTAAAFIAFLHLAAGSAAAQSPAPSSSNVAGPADVASSASAAYGSTAAAAPPPAPLQAEVAAPPSDTSSATPAAAAPATAASGAAPTPASPAMKLQWPEDVRRGLQFPEEKRRPGDYRHDGFYLRTSLGLGYSDARSTDGADVAHFYGFGTTLSVAFGGVLWNRLALFVDGFLSKMWLGKYNEVIELRDDSGDLFFYQDRLNVNSASLGFGLAYYFPKDIYTLASVGIASVAMNLLAIEQFLCGEDSADCDKTTARSDVGIAGHFAVGKDWWVGKGVALGIAAELQVVQAKFRFFNPDLPVRLFVPTLNFVLTVD